MELICNTIIIGSTTPTASCC